MKIKAFIAVLMIQLVCAGFAFSQNRPYRVGTTCANFLEMGIGSAANAMGEAYVAMATDLSSVYWNPAGLSYLEKNEVQFTYQPWLADIYVGSIGVGMVIPRIGNLAFGITSMNYGRTDVTTLTMQEGTGETYSSMEYAASFTFSRKLAQWFAFGASGKYIASQIWHLNASAMALDLGVTVNTKFFSFTGARKDGMTFGMSISNYGTKMRYNGMDLLRPIDIYPDRAGNYKDVRGKFDLQGWELPLLFRMGAAVHPLVTNTQRLTVAMDALHPNNNSEYINLGAQYQLIFPGTCQVFLRGGYNSLFMNKSEFGFTAGGGIYWTLLHNKMIKFDYAFQDIGVLGNTSTLTVGLTF